MTPIRLNFEVVLLSLAHTYLTRLKVTNSDEKYSGKSNMWFML
jgi:hypothetical protein